MPLDVVSPGVLSLSFCTKEACRSSPESIGFRHKGKHALDMHS